MNSAQLHEELLESGERLITALAREREANVYSPRKLTYDRWENRLRRARCEVERAAQSYAGALHNFRTSMLAEFIPGDTQSRRTGPVAKHRERVVHPTPGAFRNRWRHTPRNSRLDLSAEVFPVAPRLSKSN